MNHALLSFRKEYFLLIQEGIYLLKFIEDFLFRKNGEKFMVLTFSCENDINHKFIISCTYNICKARILSDPKKRHEYLFCMNTIFKGKCYF